MHRYDISDDGHIDQKELTKMITAIVKSCFVPSELIFKILFQYDLTGQTNRSGDYDPKTRAADIIAQIDVSGEKKLSREEFIAGYVFRDFSFRVNIDSGLFIILDVKVIHTFVKHLLPMLEQSIKDEIQSFRTFLFFLSLSLSDLFLPK